MSDRENAATQQDRIQQALRGYGIVQIYGGDADQRLSAVADHASAPCVTIHAEELGDREAWRDAKRQVVAEAETIVVADFDTVDDDTQRWAAQMLKGSAEGSDAQFFVTANDRDAVYAANPDLSGRVYSVDVEEA